MGKIINCNINNSDNPEDQIVSCYKVIKEIDENLDKDTIFLDMTKVIWVGALSSLLLGHKISQLPKNKVIIIPPEDANVKNYLNYIGFPLGGELDSIPHFPICHFSCNANKYANHLLNEVENTFPKTTKNNIPLIIGELTTNIEEHSKYTHASIMSQYFPKKKFIDIGVIDNGMSIPKHFQINGIKFNNDEHAIEQALSGVSSKKEFNRGSGLPTTENLINKGLKGELYIFSREGVVMSTQNGRKVYKLPNLILDGTLCYARFKEPKKNIEPVAYIK